MEAVGRGDRGTGDRDERMSKVTEPPRLPKTTTVCLKSWTYPTPAPYMLEETWRVDNLVDGILTYGALQEGPRSI